MDENETQEVEPQNDVEEVLEEGTPVEPKVEKPKETLQDKKARLQRELKQVSKKLGEDEEEPKQKPSKANTGELDETQLDYLDLKGISDDDEIAVIQKIVQKTGMTVRQALKDEYVVAKLKEIKSEKDVKGATPSATKRSGGGQATDLALALDKYERTGELPSDFALASQVVNAKVDKETTNKPSWRK